MACYALYGQVLASTKNYNRLLPPAPFTSIPDIRFTEIPGTAPPPIDHGYTELYSSIRRHSDGSPVFSSWQNHDGYRLRLAGIASYSIKANAITCYPDGDCDEATLFAALVGPVMAFWQEVHDICIFHAAAVADDNGCILFAGNSGAGKSTLAASMVKKAGHNLVTDDQAPVIDKDGVFLCHSGHRTIRLSPEQVHSLASVGAEQTVPAQSGDKAPIPVELLAGRLATGPAPVRRIYLLDRAPDTNSSTHIHSIRKRDALLQLLGNQHTLSILNCRNKVPDRLAFLARLVSEIPVRALHYPTGYENLPDVIEAVIADRNSPAR